MIFCRFLAERLAAKKTAKAVMEYTATISAAPMERYWKMPGTAANSLTTSKMYVSKMFAGHASQPAKAGNSMPAKAAVAVNSMAKGISGTTKAFASRPIKDNWPKVINIRGRVISSAQRVSSTTMPKTFGRRRKNFLDTKGAISKTPKNAKKDKYQPKSLQS